MTEIREDILNSVPGARKFQRENTPSALVHNWLYSVVPDFREGIYLAGYCKQCRNAFTVRLKQDESPGFVLIDKLDIPTGGCIPVE